MNKTEMIDAIADKANITKADAAKMVTALTEVVTESLVAGNDVTMPGFGKFAVSHRAARTVRNPRTGETSQADAYRAPIFKAGAGLKAAVKG